MLADLIFECCMINEVLGPEALGRPALLSVRQGVRRYHTTANAVLGALLHRMADPRDVTIRQYAVHPGPDGTAQILIELAETASRLPVFARILIDPPVAHRRPTWFRATFHGARSLDVAAYDRADAIEVAMSLERINGLELGPIVTLTELEPQP